MEGKTNYTPEELQALANSENGFFDTFADKKTGFATEDGQFFFNNADAARHKADQKQEQPVTKVTRGADAKAELTTKDKLKAIAAQQVDEMSDEEAEQALAHYTKAEEKAPVEEQPAAEEEAPVEEQPAAEEEAPAEEQPAAEEAPTPKKGKKK